MTARGAATLATLVVLLAGVLAVVLTGRGGDDEPSVPPSAGATPVAGGAPSPSSVPTPQPSPTVPARADRGLVGASTVGQPWGVDGLLSFRGNPTRTWYGRGPVPPDPEVVWRHPDQPMCTEEVVGYEDVPVGSGGDAPDAGGGDAGGSGGTDVNSAPSGAAGEAGEPSPTPSPDQDDAGSSPAPAASPTPDPSETAEPDASPSPSPAPSPRTSPSPVTKLWCGTGWTGQPAVWERPDGITEVVFGGFDGRVHFLDAANGEPTRPPFRTGDMIKGSVTLDPDGLPLLYTGSRDGYLRVIALDRPEPTELWRLAAHEQGVWNNDWDGNPVVIGDLLLQGGEDSWFYAIRLGKQVGDDGLVQVDPEVLVEVPGFDERLFDDVGDANVSIESSVAVFEDRAYFANSGGRVVGLDLSAVDEGEAPVVFDYWVGDDVDATVVVDEEGMLYVAAELERFLPRAEEVGQLVKLDPYASGDPRVWGVAVPPLSVGGDGNGGIWGTPALHGDVLYVTTHPGDLLVVDRADGEVVWEQDIGYHEWSSPVVVDETLIVAGCEAGGLLAWSLEDPRGPTELWQARTPTGACIESTPAVWGGSIYVGTRDGYFYAFR